MRSPITRFITIVVLTIALFVPNIRSAHAETVPSATRPPIPTSSSLVSNTGHLLFSNGLTIDSNGTITLSGTSYYANGNTIQYPDGTLVYPNGTVVYPNNSQINIIN